MSYGKSQLNGKCQIILAAIIFGGVVSFVDFAAFASEPSGKGRVIEFGWDTPTIPWLCENVAVTECTTPFHGIILDLARREGQAGLSRHVWVSTAISSDLQQQAEEDIVLLNDADFMRLRENSFFRINSSGWSSPPDWFDSDFNTVVSNNAFIAAAVNQTSLAGVAFDPEDYHFNSWYYPGQKYSATKTFEQYEAQVRQRGREIASAIKSACPERDFTLLFLFANSLPYISTQWWGHPLPEDSYGLLPAFVDGLLDEAGEQIRIIDGIESAYPNKTLADFQSSISNYQGGASLSADPSRYLSCVGIGFGTWMDYRSNDLGWYTNPNEFNLNHFTPETFNQAMDISTDLAELSWVYTQIPDWYLGTVPEAYFNALADVTGLPPAAPCIELWARLLRAKDPFPSDAAQNVHPNVVLSWQAGIKAASHDVYFGTDFDDINNANDPNVLPGRGRQDACSYDPLGDLDFGQTYYWRIDEVNEPNAWKGDVWHFTVAEYLVVDDMESYTAEEPDRIYDTWHDWSKYQPVGGEYPTAAQVTIETADANVHGGEQSMKFQYNNSDDGGWYFYRDISEIDANTIGPQSYLEIGQDCTVLSVKALTLHFIGHPNNDANEQMYVALKDSAGRTAVVPYGYYDDEDMNDIKKQEWQEWNIRLEDFNDINDVDLTDVTYVYIGFGNRDNPTVGGSGIVHFDDIRLYVPRCIPDYGPAADLSGNCIVDFADLQIMADEWLKSGDIVADLYWDNKIDFKDYAILTEGWLEQKLWPPE